MKVALIDATTPACESIARGFSLRGHTVHRIDSVDLAAASDLLLLDAITAPDYARTVCFGMRDSLDAPIVWVVTRDRDGRPWVDAGASEWVAPGADPQWLETRVMLAERMCSLRRELTTRGAEAERERMNARLLMADRMVSIGTLAASIAHEINNPLTSVYTNIEHLARSGALTASIADPERRRVVEVALERCREGSERVRQITRNLLTFARSDQNNRRPVFVEELLESAVALCMNELRHRSQVVTEFHPVPPVEANPARLAQVFLNLLLNAVRSIPEGNAEGNTVTLSVNLDRKGRVEVVVRDTGAGIPPEHLDRVFDFTSRPANEGSGLSLAVCHNLVSEIGGEISVESVLGRGSVFRVALPSTRPEPMRSSNPVPETPRRASVLIIDDETNLRISLGQILAMEHQVTLMASAREALAAFTAGKRFDVVLCDLMMPEMSGIELYDTLTTVAPDQIPRMIFLTGGAFTSRAQAFLERIENPRIEKPFELDTLRTLIQHTLVNTPSANPPGLPEAGKP